MELTTYPLDVFDLIFNTLGPEAFQKKEYTTAVRVPGRFGMEELEEKRTHYEARKYFDHYNAIKIKYGEKKAMNGLKYALGLTKHP